MSQIHVPKLHPALQVSPQNAAPLRYRFPPHPGLPAPIPSEAYPPFVAFLFFSTDPLPFPLSNIDLRQAPAPRCVFGNLLNGIIHDYSQRAASVTNVMNAILRDQTFARAVLLQCKYGLRDRYMPLLVS